MLKDRIEKTIREIPDFPKKGINFKDITSLLLDPQLTSDIVDAFALSFEKKDVDAIVGIESRGFLFGFLLAQKLNLPFIPIRKSGKLPGETISCSYDLEYGSAEIEIHKKDIKEGWNVVIHDDLLATGGTALAAAKLIKILGGKIKGFTFVIELKFLNGSINLKKYSDNIISLKKY
ncbi:MAG: adenine phosphoribosyltransferase [Bacteroidota bacterium]|nr:adenine phosphoribosyltransferase [Bacteroidota bacterium]